MGFKGKLHNDTRCGRCHWTFGHIFHICLDPTEEIHQQVIYAGKRTNSLKGHPAAWRDAEYRANISAALKLRWEKDWEAHKKRNLAIVERYKVGDIAMKALGREFGVGFRTVQRVLYEAEAQKLVTLRKPGQGLPGQRAGQVLARSI